MSSNFNNAKIINVYYNKGDRKPYDVNGKPIAYIGEEFIGANEATELRFHFGEELDSASAIIVAKRANGDTRLDPLELVGTGVNSYFKVRLNAWYAEYKGKMTIIFKVYNGTITYDDPETPTQIVSTTGQIIVSDIFNLEVAYAPNASSLVPPFETQDYDDWFFTLSTKLDKAQSITVTGALPSLAGGVYDDRYFYVEDEGTGRLYYINGSTAIEVVFQVGTLRLTPTGNGEVTADTGKLSWNQPNGTVNVGLYNDVTLGLGEDVFYYGKASGAIVKGDIVQFAGTQGDHYLIKKAVPAEINANPKLIMGIAKQDMDNNEFGYVAHFGKIEGIDTKGYAVGSFVYFSSGSVNNGEWTITQPTAPNAKILVAVIVKEETSAGANNGVLLVRPTIEPVLKELQDVYVTSIANNQILRWNNSTLRWENTSALTTAETNITDLQGRMTTEEANVDNLQGRMTNAESNILNIEDGTTVVGKALADQNGNVINTTYLTQSSASATYIPLSQKGANNGVVPLNSSGKISSIYLSGEQDDFIEYADLASFPLVGEADIIYCAIDTGLIYRWTGSTYGVISPSLALGTTATTAFPGDRGLALETLTDNIVDGDQALTLKNQVITNTAVGTQPLIVNAIASTTADLQQWQLNNVLRARVDINGHFVGEGIYNRTNFFNSLIQTLDNGTLIYRNINNTNPALIVNKNLGTGNILQLQSAGANKLEVDVNGNAFKNGNIFLHNTGSGNLGVGDRANRFGGTSSTGVGHLALFSANATGNTSVGHASLFDATGGGNTAIGESAGRTITTGANNTFVGNTAGYSGSQLVSAVNSTAIGNGSFTDKSNQMVFGNASVTEFKFDRNTSATILAPQILGSSTNAHFLERTTTDTSTISVSMVSKRTSSGDMIDGFGTGINFQIRDNANVDNPIANIYGVRSGADNSGRLAFYTYLTGTNNERMTILPNGNVGIGTVSPATLLSVVTSSNTDGLQIRRNSDTTSDIALLGFRITTSSGFENSTEIRGVRTNRTFGGDSDLRFLTRSNNILAERLTIRDDGNVGIGTTTSLDEALTVNGTMASPISLARSGGTNTNTSLRIKQATSSWYVGANANSDFGIHISADLSTSHLRIRYGGEVGINETSPSAQLQVKSGATNRVPLIVDTLASHATNLQEWRINGSALSRIDVNGHIRTTRVANQSDGNNSYLDLLSTGSVIYRNIADTNPALIVNLANASATGNIQVWQKAGTAQAWITQYGGLVVNDTINNGTSSNQGYLYFPTTGPIIQRNINDANVVLKVKQANVSATGRIQEWIQGSTVLAYTDNAGDFYNFTGTYGTISDLRVKENIVEARDYTEDLMKLRVVKYSLKKDQEQEATKLGFIAQEVEQVFPNMVQTTETDEIKDLKSIKMSVLIPMLVKTIQELNKRIEELEKK